MRLPINMEDNMFEVNRKRYPNPVLRASAPLLPWALFLMASTVATVAHSHSAGSTPATKPPTAKAPTVKAAPRLAPAFTLPGTDGKSHSLAEQRSRSTVLFFFCGCRWCHHTATSWSTVQRSGALTQIGAQSRNGKGSTLSKGSATPLTLVVFLGDKNEVTEFAHETHLDLKQTVLLTDPAEKVSSLYQAAPCPRVFVVDGQGVMRYTNNEKGADSYKIPAPLITARTVDALRAVTAQPPAATTAKPAAKHK
jgi:hypothetical protein